MSTPTAARSVPTRPRRRWRWWHIALLVVGGAVGLVALWIVLLVVSLAGGLDDLFAGDPPREGDPDVVAARERASQALDADIDLLTHASVTPALGAGAAPVGGGEIAAPCQQGQHNWKIDDDFDLACDLARVEIVTDDDKRDFRTDMVRLDTALRAAGWSSGTLSMTRVLNEYWDALAVPTEPGTAPTRYSMDDLPSAQYTRTVDGRVHTVGVSWAESTSGPNAITFYDDWSTFSDATGNETQPADLVAAVPDHGYAVVITESVEYFRG